MRDYLYENVICLQVQFHVDQTHFHMKTFCTMTRFETEAQANSGMSYPVKGTIAQVPTELVPACLG